jgi:hypothetical protein
MTRVPGGGWLGWALLGATFWGVLACQAESPSDDEDGDDPSGFCGRLGTLLAGCGMAILLPELDDCVEPDDDEGRCSATCLVNTSCDELRMLVCSNAEPPELDACRDACLPPPFTCGSGETIPDSSLCDGFPDCFDESDEAGDCPACSDGTTLPTHWVCDGYPDCSDGADEVGCPTFTCRSGEMLPEFVECDYYLDCADGSDEHTQCPNRFTCRNGHTVDEAWECDGYPDCLDGSDEHSGCPSVTCTDGTIVLGERCDEFIDCLDGSDEPASCPPTPEDQVCGTG